MDHGAEVSMKDVCISFEIILHLSLMLVRGFFVRWSEKLNLMKCRK